MVLDFEGRLTAARFARWDIAFPGAAGTDEPWTPVPSDAWSSSLDAETFRSGVVDIRERIAAGDVYQVNLCRVLEATLAEGTTLHALHDRLRQGTRATSAIRPAHVPRARRRTPSSAARRASRPRRVDRATPRA